MSFILIGRELSTSRSAQHVHLLAIMLLFLAVGCTPDVVTVESPGIGVSPVADQVADLAPGITGVDIDRLAACGEGAWSPEVDVQVGISAVTGLGDLAVSVMDGDVEVFSNEFDGIVYVSDGDLISTTMPWLCALNAELLYGQYGEYMRFDLGLDAAHILDFETGLVAFSTELNDPHGMFTDGDLLFSRGGSIPNRELMFAAAWDEWELEPYAVGLDALYLVGPPEKFADIIEFAVEAGGQADRWSPGQLQLMLEEAGVDIWFSIEGTLRFPLPGAEELIISPDYTILDGDVVSARDGRVVMTQGALRPNTQADFRDTISSTFGEGRDYGLDALSGTANAASGILFSIENDISIDMVDSDIIEAPVDPALTAGTVFYRFDQFGVDSLGIDDFLGLDALWYPE